jgi:transposase
VLNKYKVGKHFELNITDQSFDFSLREDKIDDEAALDGVYVIRTDVSKRKMSADDTVRNYKSLSTVERAFRSMKTIDLKVRPIHHRRENRVRAHILMCSSNCSMFRRVADGCGQDLRPLGVGAAVPLDNSGSCRKAIVPTMPLAA